MQSDAHLRELFNPASIAVVGASRSPHKLGNVILSNLISAGYKGTIFPVNPNGGEILGLKAYPSAAALPRPPDLGIIVLPREKVLAAMQELAKADVDAICVITAGFRETGRDGFQLEMEMAELARRKNITLLGPNTLGLVNTSIGLNATIAQAQPNKGSISFFSQSGALCSAILDWADGEDIGFSKFVSLGNKAGVSEADVMEALGDDPDTKVIIGYLESVDDGQKFLAKARTVTDKKPVIMIKAGTTPAGARATSSHTGSLAGNVEASTAAFKQAGIIRVESLESLFDLARAFAEQPLPTGPNLTVITNSGGPGILAADACEDAGLHLVRPSRNTLEMLSQSLPPFASLYNPIDIIGDAKADRYRLTLEAVAQDENTQRHPDPAHANGLGRNHRDRSGNHRHFQGMRQAHFRLFHGRRAHCSGPRHAAQGRHSLLRISGTGHQGHLRHAGPLPLETPPLPGGNLFSPRQGQGRTHH